MVSRIRYLCSYAEKCKSQEKEVALISTYEEFSILLGIAMLIVTILIYVKK